MLSTDTSGSNANGWAGTGESVGGQLAPNHGTAPAVIGQVMSYNDPNFSVFWTYDCNSRNSPPTSSAICVGKHIGETSLSSVDPRLPETLGVIIVEQGNGTTSNGIVYRAQRGADTIQGVDNGQGSYATGAGYTLGVATQMAMDGVNGDWAVLYGANPFLGNTLTLAIDEDTISDTERAHTTEEVAYWIFSVDPGLSWMEVRKFSNISGSWSTVTFYNTYTSPVAVCTYRLPSNNDNEAVVRISNVASNSMQIRLQRPQNSSAVTPLDVHCLIMEEGVHNFNGLNVEAKKVISNGTNRNIDWSSGKMEQLSYGTTFTNPVVLGQVMSYNDARFSQFWSSNGTRDLAPDASNLYVGKHIGEESVLVKYRQDETIGFIIGAPHEGVVNNVYYALQRGSDTIRGVGNTPPYSYSFSSYAHQSYTFGVVSQNAEDGGNGGWAVLYGNNPIGSALDLAIEEKTVAGDTTRSHTTEEVAYWVFDPYPLLELNKTSCVLNDPVNGTANPKRIPGATIRYAIEVKNSGYRDAENVLVTDTLHVDLNASSVSYLQVQSGQCDCIGAASANNNGPGGGVSGSVVTLDFQTVPKGTLVNTIYECGYLHKFKNILHSTKE